MSESMIERVARAKWAHRQKVARRAGITPPLDDWDDELESLREEVRAETRAAIEAMREPTNAMVKVGRGDADEEWITDSDLTETWQDMIDAALNEKSPTADQGSRAKSWGALRGHPSIAVNVAGD